MIAQWEIPQVLRPPEYSDTSMDSHASWRGRPHATSFIRKEWRGIFLNNPPPYEEGPYVSVLRQSLDLMGLDLMEKDPVRLLTIDGYTDGCPHPDTTALIKLCEGASLSNDESDSASAATRRAWLHDSSYNTHTFRPYKGTQSAFDLCQHLYEKPFGHASLPDANQRLIYIPDLDASYALALVQTARGTQVDGLIAALSSYLQLKTVIQVKLSVMGFPSFQLHFHIPFYALRRRTHRHRAHSGGNAPRTLTDLTFLTGNATELHDAQASFTICGTGETHWNAYLFMDTQFNDSCEEELDDVDEYDDDYLGDRLRSMNKNAKDPVWNPRVYFLEIINHRMAQVLYEWSNVMLEVRKSIDRYTEAYPCTSTSPQRSSEQLVELARNMEWVNKTGVVLKKLHGRLQDTNQVWRRFSADGGDIDYFSDLCAVSTADAKAPNYLFLEILGKYEELEGFERVLENLIKHCNEYRGLVQSIQMSLLAQMTLDDGRSQKTVLSKVAAESAIQQSLLEKIATENEAHKSILKKKAAETALQQSLLEKIAQENSIHYSRLEKKAVESGHQQGILIDTTREGVRTAQRTGFATEFSIWAVAPISIACAFFDKDFKLFKFKRDEKSFIISVVVFAVILGIVIWAARVEWRAWYRLRKDENKTGRAISKNERSVLKNELQIVASIQDEQTPVKDSELENIPRAKRDETIVLPIVHPGPFAIQPDPTRMKRTFEDTCSPALPRRQAGMNINNMIIAAQDVALDASATPDMASSSDLPRSSGKKVTTDQIVPSLATRKLSRTVLPRFSRIKTAPDETRDSLATPAIPLSTYISPWRRRATSDHWV